MVNKGTILLVDGDAIVREGLTLLLSQHGLGRIESAGSLTEARGAIQRWRPDVVVLDLFLGHQSSLNLVKTIRQEHPKLKVLMLSMQDEAIYAERCLLAGAMGYIMKSAGHLRIVEGIRQVRAGKTFVSEVIRDRLWRHAIAQPEGGLAQPEERLTDRELEVYRLIGQGLATRQIAKTFSVSAKTIQTYRNFIKNKLEIATAAELVHRAVLWVKEHHP